MILGAGDGGAPSACSPGCSTNLTRLWPSLGPPMGTSVQGVSFPVVGSKQRGARALGRAPWCLGLCWEHVWLLARLSPASPFGTMGRRRAEPRSQGRFRVVHGLFFYREGGMRRGDAWPSGGFLSPAASQLSRSLSLVVGKGLRLPRCPAWEQLPAAAAAVFPFRGC